MTASDCPTGGPRGCDAAMSRVFEVLGKRWNGVLIAVLTGGPAGFAELRRAVAGISDSVLSDRLVELADEGLVVRTVQEGPPVSVSYRLSEAGLALMPALEELRSWASDHLTDARPCPAVTASP